MVAERAAAGGDAEVRRLRASLRDLTGLMALPALWAGADREHILAVLVDALQSVLRPDLLYIRLADRAGGAPLELARAAPGAALAGGVGEIRARFGAWLAPDGAALPGPFAHWDGGAMRVARAWLGAPEPAGAVLACSWRADFPTETEALLLQVAANQATVALMAADRLAERARAETALAAARDELDTVLGSVADGITVQGPDGTLRYANDAAARLIGFASAEALVAAFPGKILSRFRVSDEHGAPLAPDQLPGATARRTGRPVDAVLRYQVVATGETRWSQVRAVPVFDDAGGLRFTVTAFQDITTLRRADEIQQRLAAIVASSTDAIVSKTLGGVVTSWNASAERIFGYTAEEMVGQTILRIIPPERHHEENLILARLRAGERIDAFETVRVTKDGRRLDVSLSISPVRDGAGTIIGVSKIARDITAQKQAEAERAALLEREHAALAQARRALAVRDEFLGSVSHDLRTPLTIIRGLTQLLVRQLGRLDVPQRPRLVEEVTAVERSAATMTAMVEELLDLTRLEASKPLELRREAVDLVALAAAAAREHARTAARHDLRVTAAAPALVGEWDAARLERVLANLLSNAVKYSPDGGPIEVAVRPAAGPGGPWAELTVTDRGVGIPAADLPFVFERFRRGTNVAGRVSGAGLGLAGAQRIVELHGGTITVESEEGAGTTVTVRLPLALDEPLTDPVTNHTTCDTETA